MNREQSIEFIQAIEDTKALERAILDIIDELKSEGSKEIADDLEQLIPINVKILLFYRIINDVGVTTPV